MIIDFKKFFNSLKIAISGLRATFQEEQNFRIQALISIAVVFLMIVFGLTELEKIILILVISMVLSLELINSQIEKSLDLIRPALHPEVKLIKDISAGAVLIAVFGAAIIGIMIFHPYFLNLLK